jgi:SAM-dependent methyltransferase
MVENLQQRLSAEQIAEFYHDAFVRDQAHDFAKLVGEPKGNGVVVDIGGGVGYFAERIRAELGHSVRVIDMDPASVAQCAARSVPSQLGDALNPPVNGDEACICFNLILHHLVAQDETKTRNLQVAALAAWKGRNVPIFVNEYIYESFVGRLSGKLIYAITSSRILSTLARFAAIFIPAFRANTFGVGVRFRSHDEWVELFKDAGFSTEAVRIGVDEVIKLPLRLLLIKAIRRDSFILRPATPQIAHT